jgi:hypothetical protein
VFGGKCFVLMCLTCLWTAFTHSVTVTVTVTVIEKIISLEALLVGIGSPIMPEICLFFFFSI